MAGECTPRDRGRMIRPMGQPSVSERGSALLIRAIAIPLVVLGLAFLLWKISDRLLVIGPFDRATFGWLVVIPLWLAAPIVAGVAWRSMPDGVVHVAAVVVGLALAVASGWLFRKAIAFPACDFGPRLTPAELVVPTGIVGLVLGGGIAGAGLVTRYGLRRYTPVPAIGLGVIASVVALVVTFFVAITAFGDKGCQRPPIG